jgi:hypothetical protein
MTSAYRGPVGGLTVDHGVGQGATIAVVAVPAQNPEPPPGQGEEFGKASPVALVVIITLGIVTVLLIRSMAKRIRRLPASFPREEPDAGSSGTTPAPEPASSPEDERGDAQQK